MKKKLLTTFILLIFCSALFGCAAEPESIEVKSESGEKHVVFSLFNDNNPWPIALAKDLQNACDANGISLTIVNAKGSAEKQYSDILSLNENTVDLVLLSAVDKEIGKKCQDVLTEKELPVMLIARNTNGLIGQDSIALITCDYELVGYSQGMSLVRLFGNEKCDIIELSGDTSASNTAMLSMGFNRAIEDYDNYTVVNTSITTMSTREALDAMESVIQSQIEFDAVFCHSDADALGAIQALKTAGMTPGCNPEKGEIIITSNCGFEDAIKAVSIGELYNTFDLNAHMGELVVNTMKKYWDGEFITPRIQISYREINITNSAEWIGKGY